MSQSVESSSPRAWNIPRLLISCTNDAATGGVLRWHPETGRFERVFRHQCMGLAVHRNFYVVASQSTDLALASATQSTPPRQTIPHSIFCLDRSFRVVSEAPVSGLGLGDLHDLLVIGDALYVADTWQNRVVEFAIVPPGLGPGLPFAAEQMIRPTREWRFPRSVEPDSCHLNGLTATNGRLFASIFGDFALHREYETRHKAGAILELTGQLQSWGSPAAPAELKRVAEGLEDPHSLSFQGGEFYFCESRRGRVWRGNQVFVDGLDGYVRGLWFGNGVVVVGKSSSRHAKGARDASEILVVDRMTARILSTSPVPAREIYAFAAEM